MHPADPDKGPPSPPSSAAGYLRAARQALSTGGGRGEALGYLCEALLEAGVPALIVLISLFYSPQLSDYRVGKLAALHLMAGLLGGLWLVRAGIQGRLALERLPVYRPLLAYLGLALLSLALAFNRLQGAEVLLTQAWLLLLCLLAMHHFRDPAAAQSALWTAALCALVVALLGLLQYQGIHLLPTIYGDLPVSTLGNPNFAAHYLELLIPLILGLMAARRRRWERALLGVALALAIAHLVVASSRAGWLALGAALAFWCWPYLARGRRWLHQLLVGGLAALLLSAPLGLVLDQLPGGGGLPLGAHLSNWAHTTWERAQSGFDPDNFSVAQRLVIWGDTAALIADHPLLGVGPGNFELSLLAYRSPPRHREWKELMGDRPFAAYEAENEYLEFAAEGGLLGLAAVLWLLGAVVWSGWSRLRRQDQPELAALARGCLAGLVATLVHCAFSFNLQDPASATLFWLLGGLVVALHRGAPQGRVLALGSAGRRALALGGGLLLLLAGAGAGLCIAAGDYYYTKGRKLQAAGQPNRASLEYARAIAWRPWDFRYHHSLGLAHLEGNRPAEAEQALRRSAALHPNNPAALRLLGQALWRQAGKADQAAAFLGRAAELDPLNPQGHQWLARALQEREDFAGAVAAWEAALALQPQDPETLMRLGIAHGSAGQLDRAQARLEEAARLQPQNAAIQGNLGAVYLQAGQLDRAEALLRQAVAAEPAQLNWQRNLFLVLVRQRRVGEALQLAEPLLRAAPGDEQVRRLVQALGQRLPEEGP
jgi:Flp pilus assembly protein TadD/O-antigen ligase